MVYLLIVIVIGATLGARWDIRRTRAFYAVRDARDRAEWERLSEAIRAWETAERAAHPERFTASPPR